MSCILKDMFLTVTEVCSGKAHCHKADYYGNVVPYKKSSIAFMALRSYSLVNM